MKQRAKPIRVLITGGPTRAYLDRVRFLTNVSTGALAFELASELRRRGALVSIVVGPSAYDFEKLKLARCRRIETTGEMYEAVMRECRAFRPDVAVFSAAVLDFAPAHRARGKVSSKKAKWTIDLKPTPKIIDEVGERFPKVKRVGFKLEWEIRRGRALERFGNELLRRKKIDGVCVNFLPEVEAVRHRAHLFGEASHQEFRTKTALARGLAQFVETISRPA